MTKTPSSPPPQTTTIRKLIVEVVDALDLLPKDGQGSSSPYVIAEFDGQRKRTSTKFKDLNPVWNEKLEFIITDLKILDAEELEIEVFNDKKMSNSSGSARKNHFLGRVKLYGSQLSKKGNEGLNHFPLEKKNVFSYIRGKIGLRIYNQVEQIEIKKPDGAAPEKEVETKKSPEDRMPPDIPAPTEPVQMTMHPPPIVIVKELKPLTVQQEQQLPGDTFMPVQPELQFRAEVRKMQIGGTENSDRVKLLRRTNGDYASGAIANRFTGEKAYDLVESMHYLFIRIGNGRGLSAIGIPYVKIRMGNHILRSKPASYRPGEPFGNPEWNQVFALSQNQLDSNTERLEISVWDGPSDQFIGGVCFGLSDVPVRDPPDSPLAPQWFRLEGDADQHCRNITGNIQLSVWIGTQADDAFPESWSSDAPYVSHTRSKVYQSPKLWYLRVTVIEAQDLHISSHGLPATTPEIRVEAKLGFQSVRTRRGTMNNHSSAFSWHEDLFCVASEPLEDHLILRVEDRAIKIGHVNVPLTSIEQRLDERHVADKWFVLEGESVCGCGSYLGRIHLRLCLEGGYHVLDEAAHVCSDFRPTAKQLWKPAVGVLELGILGCRGLLPMKTRVGGKGSTDAYCVAKYGKKWVRTKTITDSFDPRWNEQYTWQVYDPCTVLTVGVFDNWRIFADMAGEKIDYGIGKVRIRVSTLESNKVYKNSYPLLVLERTGVKKMGEIELAVRFASPSLVLETCDMYGQPLLPRMHYLCPLGVAKQEVLRRAATKMVAEWLERSEPPLGSDVVEYMLDADSHAWSMRKSKANWYRIIAVLGWAVGLLKWVDDIRRWRNRVTTILVHVLYLVLVWFPDLVVPTMCFYVFLIGVWYYRFRPKNPAGMDIRLSQAQTVNPDEMDEEFDGMPSQRTPDIVRIRYDRLRTLGARIQTVLGDIAAQGERVQALVSWRDPRATRMFIGVCLAVAVILYVTPPKMVAVALGFYFLRHPMFRDPMPPASLNFFRRLPSLSDRLL
ncbi:hypothetical protein HHK36_029741 [Tetracentron sinense]|uniref:C2 domain-containing protein n=1 Tax=Tetracentron sinense TaxID=13715 RepID=A0A835CZW6_TETSI|nr:hypothetical protein HHK36_029741 [Tetracentron sinense]